MARKTVLAGLLITLGRMVLHCIITFAGGLDAGMESVRLRDPAGSARAALVLAGFGMLVWLIGSLTHLRGALQIDDDDASAEHKLTAR